MTAQRICEAIKNRSLKTFFYRDEGDERDNSKNKEKILSP
jgi:hypothetical protein